MECAWIHGLRSRITASAGHGLISASGATLSWGSGLGLLSATRLHQKTRHQRERPCMPGSVDVRLLETASPNRRAPRQGR